MANKIYALTDKDILLLREIKKFWQQWRGKLPQPERRRPRTTGGGTGGTGGTEVRKAKIAENAPELAYIKASLYDSAGVVATAEIRPTEFEVNVYCKISNNNAESPNGLACANRRLNIGDDIDVIQEETVWCAIEGFQASIDFECDS
jgi:hypothetical protein